MGFRSEEDGESGVVFWISPENNFNQKENQNKDEKENFKDKDEKENKNKEIKNEKILLLCPGICGCSLYAWMIYRLAYDSSFKKRYRYIVGVDLPVISGYKLPSLQPGVKTPMPTAEEVAEAIERLACSLLGYSSNSDASKNSLDMIGHSFGGLVVSYVGHYRPHLLDKQVYAESQTFAVMASKGWHIFFGGHTIKKALKNLFQFNIGQVISFSVITDMRPQHLMHNSTYFFEYCNRETTLKGKNRVLIIAGDQDDHVFLIFFFFFKYMSNY